MLNARALRAFRARARSVTSPLASAALFVNQSGKYHGSGIPQRSAEIDQLR